jgi:hypothetical protein
LQCELHGTGINFAKEQPPPQEINDVVYHEHGHEVNGRLPVPRGPVQEWGMNEAIDIWALSLTQNRYWVSV